MRPLALLLERLIRASMTADPRRSGCETAHDGRDEPAIAPRLRAGDIVGGSWAALDVVGLELGSFEQPPLITDSS